MLEFMQILAMEFILHATWPDWMDRCDREEELEKARQQLDHAGMYHGELTIMEHKGETFILSTMGSYGDDATRCHYSRTYKCE